MTSKGEASIRAIKSKSSAFTVSASVLIDTALKLTYSSTQIN